MYKIVEDFIRGTKKIGLFVIVVHEALIDGAFPYFLREHMQLILVFGNAVFEPLTLIGNFAVEKIQRYFSAVDGAGRLDLYSTGSTIHAPVEENGSDNKRKQDDDHDREGPLANFADHRRFNLLLTD